MAINQEEFRDADSTFQMGTNRCGCHLQYHYTLIVKYHYLIVKHLHWCSLLRGIPYYCKNIPQGVVVEAIKSSLEVSEVEV